jgi:D-alanyl-D-alanine carboxypeptidase
MNTLANYCGMEQSAAVGETSFSINGTKATFFDGESKAIINGIEIEMPEKASIKNGYCLVPASSLSQILWGVDISVGKSNTVITAQKDTVYMIVKEPSITYKTNMSEYLEYLHSKDEYIFTLANKENPLERDFPEDKDSLIEIPSEYRKDSVIYLYTVAEKALEAMMNDMFALGYNDVYVTSAYRSYAYQEVLFNMYVEDEMESGLSYDQAVQKVLTYSSEPGKSEHQTGLCVDFTTKSIGGVVDDSFESTAVFQWLKNNAWKYGFILRYPEDKTNITGYSYESWHYRFVGVDIASVIYQTGICYEEYLEIFGKN